MGCVYKKLVLKVRNPFKNAELKSGHINEICGDESLMYSITAFVHRPSCIIQYISVAYFSFVLCMMLCRKGYGDSGR